MSLTVGDILNMEELRDYRILGGKKGLGREVSTVTVIDTPDPEQWIREGELLVTSGYVIKTGITDLDGLIRKMDRTGASALFVKLGSYLDSLDDETIRTANEIGFPIIHIPAAPSPRSSIRSSKS